MEETLGKVNKLHNEVQGNLRIISNVNTEIKKIKDESLIQARDGIIKGQT